ncbi:MAG: hypothetical protein WC915_06425 [archaeon]|jgi:Fe-S-cluster containining protein
MLKKETAIKKEIVNLFGKYCSKCEGACCKGGVFSVFPFERRNIPNQNNIPISDKSGKRGNVKDLVMGKNCPFLTEKGCKLKIELRTMDCLTYPVYPILKENKINGFLIHKSCPFYKEISKNKNLLRLLKKLWEIQLEQKISVKELQEWLGDDNYWKDWYSQTIKVMLK